jgi:sucrose-6-phosphate hydrolase SacC (GH32 family)
VAAYKHVFKAPPGSAIRKTLQLLAIPLPTGKMGKGVSFLAAAIYATSTVHAQSYQEQYRPQFHYTPAKNWINDPNGLVYHNDQYHMFYQYNPTGDIWGNISWGHAVSPDLMHWEERPIALNTFDAPSGPGTELYYSGSAVTDTSLSSGWGSPSNPPLVAVYTSHYAQDLTLANGTQVRSGQESQSIAYSLDDGLTWKEYEHNPVILTPPSQYAAEHYQNFRDPFVFWHAPGKYWVMAVSLPNAHKVLFYTSSNLKTWEQVSEFGPVNAVGGQWECPSLFQLQVDGRKSNTKWVLMLGLNPGGVALPQGSGTQYVVGSFDGKTFTADSDSVYPPQAPIDSTTFEDWSVPTFSDSSWTATGDFVGRGPSDGQVLTLWDKGDTSTGTLTSKNFTVSTNYIQFQIGCCSNPHNASTYGTSESSETGINLIIDGKVVQSTTGVNGGGVIWRSWHVADMIGRSAKIELVDTSVGGFGHLDVGKIVFTNTALPLQARWADWGPDYYAAVPWNGLPSNQHTAIGWMNDWAYATQIPTSPWRSAMSIPRDLSLKTIQGKVQLIQDPHKSLSTLEGGRALLKQSWSRIPQSSSVDLPLTAKTYDLVLTFRAGKSSSRFGIDVRSGSGGAGTRIGYDFKTAQMFVDRTASGDSSFNALFEGVYYAPLSADSKGLVTIRVLLDWLSVEAFGGQGESTITAQIFPAEGNVKTKLFVEGDVEKVSLNVKPVKSIW